MTSLEEENPDLITFIPETEFGKAKSQNPRVSNNRRNFLQNGGHSGKNEKATTEQLLNRKINDGTIDKR